MVEGKSRSIVLRLLAGAVLIGGVYILTYSATVRMLGREHSGLDWKIATPMAILLVVLPYVAGGLYCRYMGRSRYFPLWLGLLTATVERLFIVSVGYLFFAAGGDGTMEGISLMRFIQGEAAPYFTWPYITLGGLISIGMLWAIGSHPRAALAR